MKIGATTEYSFLQVNSSLTYYPHTHFPIIQLSIHMYSDTLKSKAPHRIHGIS